MEGTWPRTSRFSFNIMNSNSAVRFVRSWDKEESEPRPSIEPDVFKFCSNATKLSYSTDFRISQAHARFVFCKCTLLQSAMSRLSCSQTEWLRWETLPSNPLLVYKGLSVTIRSFLLFLLCTVLLLFLLCTVPRTKMNIFLEYFNIFTLNVKAWMLIWS